MQEAVLLDTSVLIHDPLSIKSYGEGVQVLIPIFVVMELDVLKDMSKREKAHVGALARQASNLILEAIKDQSVIIVTHQDAVDIKSLDRASQIRYVDLLILQTSIYQNEHYNLTLVSKDVNLRIIAESYDIKTSDYVSDSISSNIYDSLGLREFMPNAEFATSLIKSYWEGPVNIPFDSDFEAFQNEYLWFTDFNGKKHTFQYKDWTLFPVDKVSTSKAKPRNLEQRVALDMLLDPEVQLVSLLGKAGTGKTFLALAAALDQTSLYNRILLSKPVVDVGKGIGFLPGSLSEKMEPWMQSFFDNLDQINPLWDTAPMGMEAGSKEIFLEKNQIEIQPIHSIRGRSLKQAYMIIDEAQNLTKHEIKSIITRAAEGTKVVLLGDPYQVDHPYLDTNSNGLVYVIEKMKGQSIFGCVSLHKSERSTLSDIAADLL